jgi:uncharacterized protein (DUF1800 family)
MDLQAATIAAQRFGFGPRPGELKQIAADPRGWVKAQLRPERELPPALAALPAGEDDLLAFGRWLVQRRLAQGGDDAGLQRRAKREGVSAAELQKLSIEDSFKAAFRARGVAAIDARIRAASATDRPVFERLAHFWGNHFTVSAAKPASVALPPSFEREAIRPHAAGSFRAMLRASSQHPGMLVYLDNWLSVGPNSRRAQRPAPSGPMAKAPRASARDLNENLAREILELHTLGVDGGYQQADVRALAAIISGWTYQRPDLSDIVADRPATRSAAALFEFDADAHEPGPKTLLARTYRENGRSEGEAALDDLARHPSTARFIARKLVRHYIADAPPPAVIERCAKDFTASDGDIAATMSALVDSPEAWSTPLTKFKRPEEYLISMLRALNAPPLPQGAAPGAAAGMGQRIYVPPGPDGWADTADAWLTSDLVWKRIEYAQLIAERTARADVDAITLGEAALGPLLAKETREAIKRAQSPTQALTLLFSAPEFQRR